MEKDSPAAPGRAPLGPFAMAVLACSGVPVTLTMTCLVPVLPHMESALAHSSEDKYLVKMVVAAAGFAMIAGAPLSGWLSDRVGRKPVALVSLALFSLFGLAGYFIEDLTVLIATRVVVGACAAAFLTTALALIGDNFVGVARSKLMGLNVMFSTVCSLLLLPIAGWAGQIDWRNAFLLHGFGVLMLAGALQLPRGARPAATAKAASVDVKTGRQPIPWALMALGFATGSIGFTPVVYGPFRMRELGIDGPQQISLLSLFYAVAAASASFSYGWLNKRLSIMQIFVAALALCAVGMPIAAGAPSIPVFCAASIVYAIGTGWMSPNIINFAAGVADEQRGRVMGMVKGVQLLSTSAAIMTLEPLSQRFGAGGPLIAAAAFAVVIMLGCLAGMRASGPRAAVATPSA